ncbi:MAG TPA: hypothetical protein VNN20_00935 [Thermodesulfobacteriota bacterium]|nr:hypothetical protein [Thermodesulfobacteriota bacterium]
MSTVAINEYLIGFPRQSGRGFASESQGIEKKYEEFIEQFKVPESIGCNSEILNELEEIRISCHQDNWDGYGANAISYETYLGAREVIHMLNSAFLNVPMPEITPEPDGDIAFEWNDGHGRTFLFSIDDNQTLTYAGIFGAGKTHGFEILGDFLPGVVIYNLKRLFPK